MVKMGSKLQLNIFGFIDKIHHQHNWKSAKQSNKI